MSKLKWVGTIFVLIGILLTNINIYPLNIFIHGLGVLFWTAFGFMSKDKAVIQILVLITYFLVKKRVLKY